MVKNNLIMELRGTPTGGWWWQVKSTPPMGTPGPYALRSGYSRTIWGAWWAAQKAQRRTLSQGS